MRVTAVIIKNDLVLLIHRFRDGIEFFNLPGGGVEKGESKKDALLREVKEETNLDVKINKELWKYYNDFDQRTHYFFLITDFSGNLQLGGPEAERENSFSNRYILEWHKLNEISKLPLKPDFAKNKIIEEFI